MTLRLNQRARSRGAVVLAFTALTSLQLVLACADDDADTSDKQESGGSNQGGEAGAPTTGGRDGSGGKKSTGGSNNLGGDGPGTGGSDTGGSGGTESGGSGGTGGDGSGGTLVDPIPDLYVNTPAELADISASNYDLNEHGLVTGKTLRRWYDNWEENRPAGVTGRLVVLQIVPSGVISYQHLTPKEEDGVLTYFVPAAELNKARDNGLSSFETDIPDGEAADKFLKKYGLDPRKDLIVLTFETQSASATANSVVHSVGRAWLFLRYWGVPKENLALLNGSINWNSQQVGGLPLSRVAQGKSSTPPNNGTTTVRHLGNDNTSLVISAEEVIAILKDEDPSVAKENLRIVDARGGAEAYGLKKASSTGQTTCPNYTTTAPNNRCSTPFEGRIARAESVPWTQFLDTLENGYRFKSKSTIQAIFDTQSGWTSQTRPSTGEPWGGVADWTIQFCRTNQRSTVTGIVANVILGYPTRFYETSYIEWGHLAYHPTAESGQVLAENSPFRTDLPGISEHAELWNEDDSPYEYTPGTAFDAAAFLAGGGKVTWHEGPQYNDEGDIPLKSETWPKVNTESTTSRLAIDADRAYLQGTEEP